MSFALQFCSALLLLVGAYFGQFQLVGYTTNGSNGSSYSNYESRINSSSTINEYKVETETNSHNGITSPIQRSYRVSSRFGYRNHPISYSRKQHKGIDLACPKNTVVYAIGCGKVIETGYSSSYGRYVKIFHGKGYTTLYAHLNSIHVYNGSDVHKGNLIGKVGSTGRATGNHLHFEVRLNKRCQNPEDYFNF